jgi:hypothetical protein
VLVAALGRGHGDDDFAALVEALEAFAGLRLDPGRAPRAAATRDAQAEPGD